MTVLADRGFETNRSVAYPDHPLLSRGPDVLGQDRTGLVAWFVYTSGSPSPRSKRESSRVLLSRLALPSGTRFTMVLVDRGLPESREAELFDDVEVRSHRGELTDRAHFGDDASPVVEHLRPFHFDRFSEAWTGQARPDRDRSGWSSLMLRHGQLGSLPRWADLEDGRLVARLGAGNRSNALSRVQTLAAMTATADFGLARGLAGLRETTELLEARDVHLALHSLEFEGAGPRARTTDPNKVLRAAAFAGAAVLYPEGA